ncbi:hypothetical protein SDC9_185168 [bioreactor metagenome]|uniref:Uncharacterized protein n=1 Tax=bioreactor metagenome TaxID=1076179 RepID=A0A645HF39_9ZZZZ
MKGFAGGSVADVVLLDDVVFRRDRHARGKRSLLYPRDDLAADLKIFWRRVRLFEHRIDPVDAIYCENVQDVKAVKRFEKCSNA